MFKKRKAYQISDSFSKSKSKVKQDLITPLPKQSESLGTNIENAQVMESWVERRLWIKAENKINNRRYIRTKMWKDLLWILLADFIITIGFDYFVASTGPNGLIPFGFSGLARFFAILTYPDSESMQGSFYFIYLLAISVPMIIFGLIKIDVKFTLLTIYSLVMQIVIDQIINVIPVINPAHFQMIVDTVKLGNISDVWTSTVWLFIKAIFAGVLLGIGFAMPYIVDGSNGGEDFISVYVERRYQKNIANINMIAYIILFAIVIILNTVITKTQNFNPDIKYNELNGSLNWGVWDNIGHYVNTYKGWSTNDWATINAMKPLFDANGNISENGKTIVTDFVNNNNQLSNGIHIGDYHAFLQLVAHSDFSQYSAGMVNDIRFLYLFGPSLFSSIIMILLTVFVMNIVYPAHTVRTFLISTNYVDEMKQALINLGYRNAFVDWDANTQVMNKENDKKILMVTMSVSNWKSLEGDLELVDPKMTVNVLKTKKVKGQFDYEIRSDRELRLAWEILKQDKEWLKEIHEEAIAKTKVLNTEYLEKRNAIIKKYTFKDCPSINDCDTIEKLNYWKKVTRANAKQSKKRALLKLDTDWMSEWAESWAQYDYIKSEHSKAIKDIKQPKKTDIKRAKLEYETQAKKLGLETK